MLRERIEKPELTGVEANVFPQDENRGRHTSPGEASLCVNVLREHQHRAWFRMLSLPSPKIFLQTSELAIFYHPHNLPGYHELLHIQAMTAVTRTCRSFRTHLCLMHLHKDAKRHCSHHSTLNRGHERDLAR